MKPIKFSLIRAKALFLFSAFSFIFFPVYGYFSRDLNLLQGILLGLLFSSITLISGIILYKLNQKANRDWQMNLDRIEKLEKKLEEQKKTA
jgi:hypothetical protein